MFTSNEPDVPVEVVVEAEDAVRTRIPVVELPRWPQRSDCWGRTLLHRHLGTEIQLRLSMMKHQC